MELHFSPESRRLGDDMADGVKRDLKHLVWIRKQPCCVPWCRQERPLFVIHSHHVRSAANSGTGLLPPDRDTVPLCAGHHAEGHRIGWKTFEAKHHIDLAALAKEYASLSGSEMP